MWKQTNQQTQKGETILVGVAWFLSIAKIEKHLTDSGKKEKWREKAGQGRRRNEEIVLNTSVSVYAVVVAWDGTRYFYQLHILWLLASGIWEESFGLPLMNCNEW